MDESPAEAIRLKLVAVLNAEPKTASKDALSPDEYEALSEKMVAVEGVEAVDYVGDTLGTFLIKIKDGGVLNWRHLPNDLVEASTLPPEADFSGLSNPDWTGDWKQTPVDQPNSYPAPFDGTQSNTYATHFPVAGAEPDPEYKKDEGVTCAAEGKIAIVDFLWTEAHNETVLYSDQWQVDGVMLWDKVTRMAEAAGFKVDHFKDNEINARNFSKLADYKWVIMIGHGGRPGPKSTKRIGQAVSSILTADTYDPKAMIHDKLSYEEAWKKGYLLGRCSLASHQKTQLGFGPFQQFITAVL